MMYFLGADETYPKGIANIFSDVWLTRRSCTTFSHKKPDYGKFESD